MKIPRSIRIGGIEFSVNYAENLRNGNDLCYGSILPDASEIWLSSTDGTEHQRQCVTLWHEILHGIREQNGLVIENEEAVVEMFSRGIYHVLQDNGGRFFDLVVTDRAP